MEKDEKGQLNSFKVHFPNNTKTDLEKPKQYLSLIQIEERGEVSDSVCQRSKM